MKVAIIGSFRREKYPAVLAARSRLASHDIEVLTPAGTGIVSGEEFVRFASDDPELMDAHVQTATLDLILNADVVYVVAPDGYVGRTTCYEIGRVVQAGRPILFSEHPIDLPITVPSIFVVTLDDFMLRFVDGSERFRWLYADEEGSQFDVERRLVSAA